MMRDRGSEVETRDRMSNSYSVMNTALRILDELTFLFRLRTDPAVGNKPKGHSYKQWLRSGKDGREVFDNNNKVRRIQPYLFQDTEATHPFPSLL